MILGQMIEDGKRALRDAMARRTEAIAAVQALEEEIGAKFAEANRLEKKIKDLAVGKGDAESTAARLQAELAETQAALEVAQSNENLANAEIDEANKIIQQLEVEIAARNQRIVELEDAAVDMDAINKGLEDDKEEMSNSLKAAKEELAAATATAKAATAANAAKLNAIASERDKLAADFVVVQKRVAELEREASMGEVGIARLEAEKEAATRAKADMAAQMDRIRAELDAKEAALSSLMANFNRTQELQFGREREVAAQSAAMTDRVMALTRERDDLRTSEMNLKADMREAAARESKLNSDLTAERAKAAGLEQALESTRADLSKASTDLRNTQASLDRFTEETNAAKAELEEKLGVMTGKYSDAFDKLKLAMEAEAAWKGKEITWTAEREGLSTEKFKAEELNATLAKELETLKEAYGASEESKEMKLCEANKDRVLLRRRVAEMNAMRDREAAAIERANQLQELLYSKEMERRALHNTLQELKGNIRVYVRVRPFLPADADPASARALAGIADDDEEGAAEFIPDATPAVSTGADGTCVGIAPPPPRGTKAGPAIRDTKPVKFNFDHVFGQRDTQEDIFNEVSHLVQSGEWLWWWWWWCGGGGGGGYGGKNKWMGRKREDHVKRT
jgi:chromosome segregation ATPase